jgi:hypothetical protein
MDTSYNGLENVGGGRSFHGVDRLGHVDRDGQKRGITTCRVASNALASDVKAYDAGQIHVSAQTSFTLRMVFFLCAFHSVFPMNFVHSLVQSLE